MDCLSEKVLKFFILLPIFTCVSLKGCYKLQELKKQRLKQEIDCVGNEAQTPCPKTLFPVIGFDNIFLCSLGATELPVLLIL